MTKHMAKLPLPRVDCDRVMHAQRTITNEINWFIERREETKLDIVQTSRITWLGILLIVLGLLVSFLLCCFGEVIPEQKDHKY